MPRPGHEVEDVPAIRCELSDFFTENRAAFKAMTRRRLAGWQEADVEDLRQDMLAHLCGHSAPRYDQRREVKFLSFLWDCGRYFIGHALRKRRAPHLSLNDSITTSFATDDFADRRIERLAADIRLQPERYLTKKQSEVFQELIARPSGEQVKETAIKLKYRQSSSLSMMTRRINDRLSEFTDEVL
ncbi:MAG TPA: hypothetical protein VGB55_00065 [Tepidisphaeraceae bacterium]